MQLLQSSRQTAISPMALEQSRVMEIALCSAINKNRLGVLEPFRVLIDILEKSI